MHRWILFSIYPLFIMKKGLGLLILISDKTPYCIAPKYLRVELDYHLKNQRSGPSSDQTSTSSRFASKSANLNIHAEMVTITKLQKRISQTWGLSEAVFRVHDILVWIRIRGPMGHDSDLWIRIRIRMRLRILLFSSLTFKTTTKN